MSSENKNEQISNIDTNGENNDLGCQHFGEVGTQPLENVSTEKQENQQVSSSENQNPVSFPDQQFRTQARKLTENERAHRTFILHL